jgi:hypothetical protein
LYPSYVSLSIELASFPSFAGEPDNPYQRIKRSIGYLMSGLGTKKQPNVYSKNLLQYLAQAQGSPAVIRVGGNSA